MTLVLFRVRRRDDAGRRLVEIGLLVRSAGHQRFSLRDHLLNLDGNICALLGTKDYVNIFIYDPIAPDPEGIINQGQGNSAARAIQVHKGEPMKKRARLKPLQSSNRQQPSGRLAPLAAQSVTVLAGNALS